MPQPILTRIAGTFQATVPPEMREIFELQEGDLLQWDFDEANARILLLPKRAQVLTPVMRKAIDEVRAERSKKGKE
jgi:bifunctional DNA-binding transcriptional regulator/antitoxin component of YhaV-PrlF toxin-antitoxin module